MNTALLVVLSFLVASAASRSTGPVCAGCPYDMDTNSKDIRDLLTSTLSQTNSNFKLVDVKKCTGQVVAGEKIDCQVIVNDGEVDQVCDLGFLVQPWMPARVQVVHNSCSQVFRPQVNAALGGVQDVPVDSAEVTNLVDFVSQQVTVRTNAEAYLKVVKTISAKRQLVAGEKYFLRVLLSVTNCDNNVEDPKNCKPTPYAYQMCDVTVFQQPWNKIQEVTSLKCQKMYGAVQADMMTGGIMDIPTNSPVVKQLGDFVSQEVTVRTNAETYMKVIKTLSAKQQLVAGMNYFLEVLLATTNCDSNTQNPQNCKPQPYAYQKCDVTIFEQSWNNIKEVTSLKCQKVYGAVEAMMTGGIEDMPTNSPVVKELGDFVSQEVTVRTNAETYMKVIKTLSAKQQLVAGMKYFLEVLLATTNCDSNVQDPKNCKPQPYAYQKCDVTIFEQSWNNIKEVTSLKCQKVYGGVEAVKVGGLENIPVDSPVVKTLGDFVSQEMTVKTNAEVYMKVVKTVSAKHQLVAGDLYYLNVLLAPTNCDSNVQNGNNCVANKPATQQCRVTVFEQAWNNIKEVTHFQCQPLYQENVEAVMPGGIETIPVDTPVVKSLGDFVSQEMTVKTNAQVYMKVVKTISAKHQIVAGENYYLDVLLAPTNCNSNVQNGNSCSATQAATQRCQVTVFEQNWNNIKEVTHFQCQPVH